MTNTQQLEAFKAFLCMLLLFFFFFDVIAFKSSQKPYSIGFAIICLRKSGRATVHGVASQTRLSN